uniref:PCI domain-containing protein n=1 Tax=Ascaris lumbricoides TaxID=6252 RepID=A0A0M3I2X7_ASCLU
MNGLHSKSPCRCEIDAVHYCFICCCLQTGNVEAALECMGGLEKHTRLGADMKSNTRIVRHMVHLCFQGSAWALLNETIIALSKKRSIIKFAIARMVHDCCEMVDKIPDERAKWKLVETLRDVTAGKIYVEVERARLTSRLVKKLESEGKLESATTMLLELQVETYGSMDLKEKVEFLLEQMRLCVARKDFIRESILSKKISIRFFEDKSDAVQELKLKYCDLMIKLGLNDSAYLDVYRLYRKIFDTPRIQADAAQSMQVLKCMVLYVLLAPHTNEQSDLLHRVHEMRELQLVPDYNVLLKLFVEQEIIFWKDTVVAQFEELLRRGTKTSPPTDVFDITESGNKRWTDLQSRVAEHNIRMIAKYYTQISFDRMAELLDYPVDEMESFLCNMIVTGAIPHARIHRPSRIVSLRARKATIEQLDQWADSVRKLTGILNKVVSYALATKRDEELKNLTGEKNCRKVSHLILKEQIVHRHLDSATAASS